MSNHFLIRGDAFNILPKISAKVDTVIVDPPYNTANKNTKKLKGRKNRSSDFGEWDYFSDNEYLVFSKKWLEMTSPILKSNGNLIIFSKLEYVSDIKRIYENQGFRHHATIIWHKTNPAPQIRKTGFLSSCEAILWATKGFDDEKISYTFNFTKQSEMHNFIETPICMGNERTKHPTQKPEKVIEKLINIFTNERDLILDCFAGSGTTSAVAAKLKRRSISIEKDPNFFSIMHERMKNNPELSQDLKVIRVQKNLARIKFN